MVQNELDVAQSPYMVGVHTDVSLYSLTAGTLAEG